MLETHHHNTDGLWDCVSPRPSASSTHTPRPPAHRAGIAALVGEVIQALAL